MNLYLNMSYRLATLIAVAAVVLVYAAGIAGYMHFEGVSFTTAAVYCVQAMVKLDPTVGAPLSAPARDLTALLIICGPGIAAFYLLAMAYVANAHFLDYRRSRNIRKFAEQKRLERAARTPEIAGGIKAQVGYDASLAFGKSVHMTGQESAAARAMYAVDEEHHVKTVARESDVEHIQAVTGSPTSRSLGPVKPIEDTRRTVALVDDDPIILQIYTKLFEDAGVKTITASNGVDAFQMIERELPDVAIIDYRLPLLSGIQLCEKARHEVTLSKMKIILFTQDEQRQTRDHAIEAGADVVVTKNHEPSVLVGTVLGMLH